MKSKIGIAFFLLIAATLAAGQRRSQPAGKPVFGRTLTILTEANAIVWIDDIRRGTTGSGGRLETLKVSPGAHTLRVRANGFKEATMAIQINQRGEIKVRLLRTTDEAELIFQQGETARETARDGALA